MALSTPISTGFVQSFKSALGDVDVTAIEPLGTIRYEQNAVYKYVRFSGTLAVAIGDALCYVVTDLTLQTVDGTNSVLPAGIAVSVVTSGTVQYGWIQIRGLATLSTTTGAVAGNNLTNNGASNSALKVAAAITNPIVGVLVSASAPISAQINYGN